MDRLKSKLKRFFANKNFFWPIDDAIFGALSFVVKLILWIFYSLLWVVNKLLSKAVDYFSTLDPFQSVAVQGGSLSSVELIWNILKNFSYILLVFSALFAGFKYLFNEDDTAKKLIFNIIVVAFIINFTFIFVKEFYRVAVAIERGVSGGAYGKVGSIILASSFLKDPSESFMSVIKSESVVKGLGSQLDEDDFEDWLSIGFFIFGILIQMIIFTILLITLVLYLARYVLIIFYAGISSFAVATLVFPESKGALGAFLSKAKIWSQWLNNFVKWVVVIPVFLIMVILGNSINYLIFKDAKLEALLDFLAVFGFVIGWYLISIKVAISLSGKIGETAKFLAIGALGGMGLMAARGALYATGGKVGGALKRGGSYLQGKVGQGGVLGWRSFISQKIGKPIQETGEKLIQRRYETTAQGIQSNLTSLGEKMVKTTDPQEIDKIRKEVLKTYQGIKDNPYLLNKFNEWFSGLRPDVAGKMIKSPEFVETFTSSKTDIKTREAFRNLLGNLSEEDIDEISKNKNLLLMFKNAPQDIRKVFANQLKRAPSETLSNLIENHELLESLSEEALQVLRGEMRRLPRKSLDKISLLPLEEFKKLPSEIVTGLTENIDNLSKEVSEKLLSDIDKLDLFKGLLKPEFFKEFSERLSKKISPGDVASVLKDYKVRDYYYKLGEDNPLRVNLGKVSNGLSEAILKGDIGQIGILFSQLSSEDWMRNYDSIFEIFSITSMTPGRDLFILLQQSPEPMKILTGLAMLKRNHPLKRALRVYYTGLSSAEKNAFMKNFKPEQQAFVKSVIS